MTKPRKGLPARCLAFSMVEFLIAAFILGIGILGLTALMTVSLRKTALGRQRTTATYVANAVLQQAQVEGQYTYLAKTSNLTTLPAGFTPLFTATPGTAVNETTVGGYNIDGVQVSLANGNAVTGLATLVPDVKKRAAVFTASWVRRAYAGAPALSTTGPQSQEFLVNVTWVEEGQAKFLTLSRIIRY